jgi:ribosomal protein L12E/L44/L45/RPP1/RPP2
LLQKFSWTCPFKPSSSPAAAAAAAAAATSAKPTAETVNKEMESEDNDDMVILNTPQIKKTATKLISPGLN